MLINPSDESEMRFFLSRQMKTPPYLIVLIVIFSLVFSPVFVRAQENAIVYTIANDVASSNWLEFDLLLYDPDPSQPFELCAVQAGILVNSQVTGGGVITAQIIEGSSSLNSAQVPTSITFAPCESAIKLTAKVPPGCGAGTKISQDPDHRTRICRIRLNNTMPFASCSSANLTFCFSLTPFPTKLTYYPPDCNPVSVGLNPANCFSMAANQPFNASTPAPNAYIVNGGGAYCMGGIGATVELSGSETNVTYRLYKDGIAQSPLVQGTGLALYFGNQLAGTYTIEGYRTCGTVSVYTTLMSGSAIVTVSDSTVPGMVNGPDSAYEGSSAITLNLSGNNGTVLRWQKRLDSGTWTDIGIDLPSYSEIPAEVGIMEYRAKVQNSACPSANSEPWSVVVQNRKLAVKVFLQGLYQENTGMMDKARDENGEHYPGDIADRITVKLADDQYPHPIAHEFNDVALNRNGEISIALPSGSSEIYYLVLNHRNSLETWSSVPVNMGADHIRYDFTNGIDKAYGNNLKLIGNESIVYGGDVNQDGIVDSGDMIGIDNDASVFASGYLLTDANGDGLIDSGDMILVDNNASQFIGKVTP